MAVARPPGESLDWKSLARRIATVERRLGRLDTAVDLSPAKPAWCLRQADEEAAAQAGAVGTVMDVERLWLVRADAVTLPSPRERAAVAYSAFVRRQSQALASPQIDPCVMEGLQAPLEAAEWIDVGDRVPRRLHDRPTETLERLTVWRGMLDELHELPPVCAAGAALHLLFKQDVLGDDTDAVARLVAAPLLAHFSGRRHPLLWCGRGFAAGGASWCPSSDLDRWLGCWLQGIERAIGLASGDLARLEVAIRGLGLATSRPSRRRRALQECLLGNGIASSATLAAHLADEGLGVSHRAVINMLRVLHGEGRIVEVTGRKSARLWALAGQVTHSMDIAKRRRVKRDASAPGEAGALTFTPLDGGPADQEARRQALGDRVEQDADELEDVSARVGALLERLGRR